MTERIYIPHNGGPCPVDPDTMVFVRLRNHIPGDDFPSRADSWRWESYEDCIGFEHRGDIVAYSVERQGWQQRLIDERDQLAERLEKLLKFIEVPSYRDLDVEDRGLLASQIHTMCDYKRILDQRIARFES